MINIIRFVIIYILVGTSLVICSNECRVQKKYSWDFWKGDQLKIWAFIPDQDGFTSTLNFHGLNNYLFYDQIVISKQGNKVIKTNNGKFKNIHINSTLNNAGWMEFTFSIENNTKVLVKIWDALLLIYNVDFPVKTITIYSRNTTISLCSNPSWTVGENEAIVIPLIARSSGEGKLEISKQKNVSVYITLYSTAPFSPVITVNGMKRFLSIKNGEMLLTMNFSQPLHPKSYILEVQSQKKKVNINYKYGNAYKEIMEFKVATVLSDIGISSHGMGFTVDLEFNSKLRTTTTTASTDISTTTAITTTLTSTTDDYVITTEATTYQPINGLLIGIISVIALVVMVLIIILIIYCKRKKSRYQERKHSNDGCFSRKTPDVESSLPNSEGTRSHKLNDFNGEKCVSNTTENVSLLNNTGTARIPEELLCNEGNSNSRTPKKDNSIENLKVSRYNNRNSSPSSQLRSTFLRQLNKKVGVHKRWATVKDSICNSNKMKQLGFSEQEIEDILKSYSNDLIKNVLDNNNSFDEKNSFPSSSQLRSNIMQQLFKKDGLRKRWVSAKDSICNSNKLKQLGFSEQEIENIIKSYNNELIKKVLDNNNISAEKNSSPSSSQLRSSIKLQLRKKDGLRKRWVSAKDSICNSIKLKKMGFSEQEIENIIKSCTNDMIKDVLDNNMFSNTISMDN